MEDVTNDPVYLTVTFYMKGNHKIVTENVLNCEVTMAFAGGVSRYEISWKDGCRPALFSLNINDIVAVVATES